MRSSLQVPVDSYSILLASILCWRHQRSTFSPSLLWKTWVRSGDDSVFIAEGHLQTRLFPVLRCRSRVDLPGQHRPLTSWIMHYGHTLYSVCLTLLLALSLSAAAQSGPLFWVAHNLKCNTVNYTALYFKYFLNTQSEKTAIAKPKNSGCQCVVKRPCSLLIIIQSIETILAG